MGVLGYVLARRAGTSYERLVRARIGEPLGLADTSVGVLAAERRRVAAGHTARGRETPPWHLAALVGAGGLHSTAADLLAYLDLHRRPDGSPLRRGRRGDRAAPGGSRPGPHRARVVVIPARPRRLPWGRARPAILFHEGGTGAFARSRP